MEWNTRVLDYYIESQRHLPKIYTKNFLASTSVSHLPSKEEEQLELQNKISRTSKAVYIYIYYLGSKSFNPKLPNPSKTSNFKTLMPKGLTKVSGQFAKNRFPIDFLKTKSKPDFRENQIKIRNLQVHTYYKVRKEPNPWRTGLED